MTINKDSNLDKRFQIKSMPGESGKAVASFATRAEADEALRDMRKEDSVESASYIIADTGVQDVEGLDRAAVAEAGKPLEQKEAEQAARDATT